MFGSQREMMAGVMRALPDPSRTAPVRVAQIARRLPRAAKGNKPHLAALCEVAQMLTERLGLPAPVQNLFAHLTERWDGKGQLGRAKGDEIPLPLRITHVARDAAYQRLLGGEEYAARIVRERAGHAFDPAIAALLADEAHELLAIDAPESAWEETIGCEPFPHLLLEGERIDRALTAMGDFADLASPYLVGHSAGVARLAATAAERCRLEPGELVTVRRAALVHHVGRVAVPATTITPPARVLAAADAYHAMTEPRPQRAALSAEQAATILGEEAHAGRLDADAVAAVLTSAGQRVPSIERPAGLTEREGRGRRTARARAADEADRRCARDLGQDRDSRPRG
jgi:HD-GYP domain-containing protein (c-di-GMP phosphodiesterase class II)